MARPQNAKPDSRQCLDGLLNRKNELRDLREMVLQQRHALVIGLPDMNIHGFVTELRKRWAADGSEEIWAGHFGFLRGDGFQASLQSRMSIADQFCKRILEEYKDKARPCHRDSLLNQLKCVVERIPKRGKHACLLVEDLGLRPTIDERQMDDFFGNVVQTLIDDCRSTFVFFSSYPKQFLQRNPAWGQHLASTHEFYLKPIPLERFKADGCFGKDYEMVWRHTRGVPALIEKLKDVTPLTEAKITKALEGEIKGLRSKLKVALDNGELSEAVLIKMGLTDFINNQDALSHDRVTTSGKPRVVLDGKREELLVNGSPIPINDKFALLILYLIAKDPKWRERDTIATKAILRGLSSIRDDKNGMNMMRNDCPCACSVLDDIPERASLAEMTDINTDLGFRLINKVGRGRKYIRERVEPEVRKSLCLSVGFYFLPKGGSSDGGRKQGKNKGRKTIEANWNTHIDFRIKPPDTSTL